MKILWHRIFTFILLIVVLILIVKYWPTISTFLSTPRPPSDADPIRLIVWAIVLGLLVGTFIRIIRAMFPYENERKNDSSNGQGHPQ